MIGKQLHVERMNSPWVNALGAWPGGLASAAEPTPTGPARSMAGVAGPAVT